MAEYKQPVKLPVEKNNGYPNDIASTKTKPMRGTGAATKNTKYSKNSQ